MEESNFYNKFIGLYRDVNPKIASRLEQKLPKANKDLEGLYLRYLSFRNSLEDNLPESLRIPNRSILLVGAETDAENLAINEIFPDSKIYALNSDWKRWGRMSDKLAKKIEGTLGGDSLRNGESYDIIILHHLNHITNSTTNTNQKTQLYSHLKELLKPDTVCFASYYSKEELGEALGELKGTDIRYADKNRRIRPIDFREHFPENLGFSLPDNYVLVLQGK